jgi:hypothetical protein
VVRKYADSAAELDYLVRRQDCLTENGFHQLMKEQLHGRRCWADAQPQLGRSIAAVVFFAGAAALSNVVFRAVELASLAKATALM